MNIENYIKEAHKNAVEKGFYDCPECGGYKGIYPPCGHIGCYAHISHPCEGCGHIGGFCKTCNGIGIDLNKNIGELLMLIVSELGEALEAHRCGRFADLADWEKAIPVMFSDDYSEDAKNSVIEVLYTNCLKSTFEDEIAGVFIRLFDLCGYLKIKPVLPSTVLVYHTENTAERLYQIIKFLPDVDYSIFCMTASLSDILQLLEYLCNDMNIPIEKHIEAKMAYNRTRPRKHGKSY